MNGRVPEPESQEIELQGEREPEEENETDHNEPLNPEVSTANTGRARYWKSCGDIVFWKCKLWMVIASVFLALLLVIILSLILYSAVYIDEDEHWSPESVSSGKYRNFFGTLKLLCPVQSTYSEDLTKRLTDIYSSSPALGRYFISAQVDTLSEENGTALYQLMFSLPAVAEELMKYTVSAEFVLNVLRQDIYDHEDPYDQKASECTTIRLDPASLTLTSYWNTRDDRPLFSSNIKEAFSLPQLLEDMLLVSVNNLKDVNSFFGNISEKYGYIVNAVHKTVMYSSVLSIK